MDANSMDATTRVFETIRPGLIVFDLVSMKTATVIAITDVMCVVTSGEGRVERSWDEVASLGAKAQHDLPTHDSQFLIAELGGDPFYKLENLAHLFRQHLCETLTDMSRVSDDAIRSDCERAAAKVGDSLLEAVCVLGELSANSRLKWLTGRFPKPEQAKGTANQDDDREAA